MRREPRLPLVVCALVFVLAAGGCGNVRLIDPSDPGIDLAGVYFYAEGSERGGSMQLEFQGHAFGYQERGGNLYLRYLEAGEITVAGRRAERRYVRAAEPEYYLSSPVGALTTPAPIVVAGSAAVPSCGYELQLPVVALPAERSAVSRSAGLVLLLGFAPESLPYTHRVSASVKLTGGAGTSHGTVVALEKRQVRTALVIPGSLLAELPEGTADLYVRMEWERVVGAEDDPGACGPALFSRTAYGVRRTIRLR